MYESHACLDNYSYTVYDTQGFQKVVTTDANQHLHLENKVN